MLHGTVSLRFFCNSSNCYQFFILGKNMKSLIFNVSKIDMYLKKLFFFVNCVIQDILNDCIPVKDSEKIYNLSQQEITEFLRW
jgi:hypothetical protein